MKNPTVVLLAAGSSTRFWPLGDKNLLSFFDKPLISHQIEKIQQAGYTNIEVVVNHNNFSSINRVFNHCIIQEKYGIAEAVKSALNKIDGPVLFVNADDYFSSTLLQDSIDLINNKNPQAFLTAVNVTQYFPGGYLVIKDNKIIKIVEKPGPDKMPSSYFRFVFDYFKDTNLLKKELTTIVNPEDYEIAINKTIEKGLNFELLSYQDQWTSLKYPWHVLDLAHIFLSSIKKSKIAGPTQIDKRAIIKGPVIIEDGVKIFENAKVVGPCYLGKNVIVGNNCIVRESIIEEGCVLGFSTDIARSYIGPNCWFHSNYIGDSVLEENISLGAGANLANLRLDEQEISSFIKDVKINTLRNKLGTIIGKNVRIGVNTSIMPGVKIGSNTFIASAALIEHDIPENKFVCSKTELVIKDNVKQIGNIREVFKRKI